MRIKIPENGKVYDHLSQLNDMAKGNLTPARHAKKDLEIFWLNVDRLEMNSSRILKNQYTLKLYSLPIKHIKNNFYSLRVGADAYIFAAEEDLCVFLTTCKKTFDDHQLIFAEAELCFSCWQQGGLF